MPLHEDILDAIEQNNLEDLRSLLSHTTRQHLSQFSINFYYKEAIRHIKPQIVRFLQTFYNIDGNYSDASGRKLIHHAAEMGMLESVQYLVNRGAVINISDVNGYSPLHIACQCGHTDVVQYLIREGAFVNRVRSIGLLGEAPLHVASESGHLDCVQSLLKHQAKLDIISQDENLCTPLHKAISNRHFHVARLLVESGANLNHVDNKGLSPLHVAVQMNAVEFIQELDQMSGYDRSRSTARDKKGRSPLHVSVISKSSEMLRLMVHLTTQDLMAVDKDGNAPLHLACMQGNEEAVGILLEAGADIEQRSQTGETPLCTAISCARVETVRILLESGADVNIQDFRGVTPFHRAQIIPPPARLETIELLMLHGAKLNAHDHRGYTPLDRCVFNSVMSHFDREAFKLMVAAGCSIRPQMDDCQMDCPNRNSPLCWLVWKGDLESARFLVYAAGCDLGRETWLSLPGKTHEQEQLLVWMRRFAREPRSLLHESRSCIRDQLSKATSDREILTCIDKLPIPNLLKRYLEFQGEKEMIKSYKDEETGG